ncbi:expressed unknown protein [Seminavis robusta]|uniref:PDZ domain-containing protein n=1 Tax=Seminavis robusta TaxID=568900 RepID=A0A9N8DXV7_9STRA|nr:expressed unknown protein [Seminavis robusta]|eukprot:Sro327_g118430.1 n/a (681) ;mRNA; r:56185-58339
MVWQLKGSLQRLWSRGKKTAGSDLDDTLATAELEVLEEGFMFSEIPTIHLGHDEESLLPASPSLLLGSSVGIAISSSNSPTDDVEVPTNHATPVVATPVVALDFDDEDFPRPQSELDERAAYISVTAFDCNCDKKRPVGIKVRSVKGKLLIVDIRKNSVFAQSPIRVGDQIAGINGRSCDPIIDGGQATRILDYVKGTVSIVVHTEGKVGLIECMLIKPRPGCETGLKLRYIQRKLQILRLDPAGPWTFSILNEGNHILAINGMPCSQLDGAAAEALIATSETHVTILAKSVQETNLVIEEYMTPGYMNHRFFRRPDKNFPENNRPKSRCSLDYIGPCFNRVWSPAKGAHIFANVFVVGMALVAGIGYDIGAVSTLWLVLLGLVVTNLPWVGWRDRAGAWCSIGQIVGSVLVLFSCAVMLPIFFGSDLYDTLARNIGISIPMTIIINLPMHFQVDYIDRYDLDAAGVQVAPVTTNSATGTTQTNTERAQPRSRGSGRNRIASTSASARANDEGNNRAAIATNSSNSSSSEQSQAPVEESNRDIEANTSATTTPSSEQSQAPAEEINRDATTTSTTSPATEQTQSTAGGSNEDIAASASAAPDTATSSMPGLEQTQANAEESTVDSEQISSTSTRTAEETQPIVEGSNGNTIQAAATSSSTPTLEQTQLNTEAITNGEDHH